MSSARTCLEHARSRAALGVLGVLVLCAGSGCNRAEATEPEAFQGLVEFEERVLSFQSTGEVGSVLVERGDRVERGALVAALEERLERPLRDQRAAEAAGALAKLKLVRAGARLEDVLGAEGQLDAARADESQARSEFERTRRLFEANTIPRAGFESAEARSKAARGHRQVIEQRTAAMRRGARPQEVAIAEAAVQASEAGLAAIDARLASYRLFAPVSGTVLDVNVHPGETVPAAAPVLVLADVERPYVDVFVPQQRVATLGVGGGATVRVDGATRAYTGSVESFGRRVEFTPRFLFSERERPNLVLRVRVRVKDADAFLHAGVPARVLFK